MKLPLSFYPYLLSCLLSISSYGACLPEFKLTTQWRGGDAAYSVDLDLTRSLWLFGDSFISKEGKRLGSDFLGNTIGISTCKNDKWAIDYYWKQDDAGRVMDFFPSGTSDFRYWPKDGFTHEGKIYVLLIKVRQVDPTDAMGFAVFETVLARLDPNDSDPRKWPITYTSLKKSKSIFPGASVYKTHDRVLLYTAYEKGNQTSTILLSLPLDKLNSPTDQLEYLNREFQWVRDQNISSAKTILSHGSHEFSVRYHHEEKIWRMVINGSPLTDAVYEYLSDSPEGPWVKKNIILIYPEMQTQISPILPYKHVFCYAPKEHPRYQVITYVCNSFDKETIWKNETIYLPIAKPILIGTGQL